jgi:hypothetical protein
MKLTQPFVRSKLSNPIKRKRLANVPNKKIKKKINFKVSKRRETLQNLPFHFLNLKILQNKLKETLVS